MGREYTDDATPQCVTVLHSSTHPLLGLQLPKEKVPREGLESFAERMETFAEKAKEYRRALSTGTTYASRTTVNTVAQTQNAIRRMKGFAKATEKVREAYNTLEQEQQRLQTTLEDKVVDDEIGATTDKIHREICRTLNIQGINGYKTGSELTHTLTIAVYEAREEGSIVLLHLPQEHIDSAKKVIEFYDLGKQITLKPIISALESAGKN